MKRAHASPDADVAPPRPDALSLAHMAARLMEIALQRGPNAAYKIPPASEALLRTCPISPKEVAVRHAVREARILFNECAVAIGLENNPGNIVTSVDIERLATLAIQMLSAGTPRAAIVSEALSLLSTSHFELTYVQEDDADAPLIPLAGYWPLLDQEDDADASPIPAPPQWPATLGNFYRLIMKVRDKSDRKPRFLSYLYSICRNPLSCLSADWSPECADKLTDPLTNTRFCDLQSNGFDKACWLFHVRHYRRWWARDLHFKKTTAGQAGYAAKKARAAAQEPSRTEKRTRRP